MDFDFKKPAHILALLLLIATFVTVILLPTVMGIYSMISQDEGIVLPQLSDSIFDQIVLFILQMGLILFVLVLIPIIWYILVNNYGLEKIKSSMRITFENIDTAFLWGVIAAVATFVIFIGISYLLIALGMDVEDLSNVQDIQQYFPSPVILFLLIAIQPIAEEIFFRGFLLDKIESLAGMNVAIISTALLFGLAHMSYGKIYPVILLIIMGIILAYIVIKTKNIYSAITAHIIFNVVGFALSLFSDFFT